MWWGAAYVLISFLLFVLGNWLGHKQEARYWRQHAPVLARTPVASNAVFYYVLPEAEYVELELDHVYLSTLRRECGIE